jgi:hypothetical protein
MVGSVDHEMVPTEGSKLLSGRGQSYTSDHENQQSVSLLFSSFYCMIQTVLSSRLVTSLTLVFNENLSAQME